MAETTTEEKGRKVYTLTQLNTSIENMVRQQLGARTFWVNCQIAKVSAKGGHYYLELVDSVQGERTAVAKGTIWRSRYRDIQQDFALYGLRVEQVLRADLAITAQVSVEFHKVFGFSLNIHSVDPKTVLGDIEQQKRETWARLEREGLPELQKRLYLGPIARRIALVGSPQTSGFADFVEELTRNDLYTAFSYRVFEATVQGDSAVPSLVAALQEASRWDVDAIVLVRGGGSKMDLHVFNHYEVCKAIAYARVPVLVGIGHETDHTLSDRVAYASEKTPTAVAKRLYVSIGIFASDLNDALKRIRLSANELIALTRRETQSYQNTIFQQVDGLLRGIQEKIDRAEKTIRHQSVTQLAQHSEAIHLHTKALFTKANQRIEVGKQTLGSTLIGLSDSITLALRRKNEQISTLQTQIGGRALNFITTDQFLHLNQRHELIRLKARHLLKTATDELDYVGAKLALVDPNALFSKGYTISTVEGTDLNQWPAEDLKGKTMITHAGNARIESTIQQITPHDQRRD